MSDHEISASFETLMRQASMTAGTYMDAAIKDIDDHFGRGFAQEHPELIIGFMRIAASDFSTASLGIAAQKICAAIGELRVEDE